MIAFLDQFSPAGDSNALEGFKARGYVPWALFEREQKWRESLQTSLNDVFDPPDGGRGADDWLPSEHDIAEARAEILRLRAEREMLQLEVREAQRIYDDEVDRLDAEIAQRRADARREAKMAVPLEAGEVALEPFLRLCEREAIRAAMKATGGQRAQAAAALGVGRSTFYRKLADHGIR